MKKKKKTKSLQKDYLYYYYIIILSYRRVSDVSEPEDDVYRVPTPYTGIVAKDVITRNALDKPDSFAPFYNPPPGSGRRAGVELSAIARLMLLLLLRKLRGEGGR